MANQARDQNSPVQHGALSEHSGVNESQLIARYRMNAWNARGIEWRKYWQEKADQMEAEQKLKRQMAPWAVK